MIVCTADTTGKGGKPITVQCVHYKTKLFYSLYVSLFTEDLLYCSLWVKVTKQFLCLCTHCQSTRHKDSTKH